MKLFGREPKENLIQADCFVCHNRGMTIELEDLDIFVCKRCIERGILYAADEAVKHSFDSEENKRRYIPPPPPPTLRMPPPDRRTRG